MSRFLHVADLHLDPEEYEYSAGVLAEIQALAGKSRADAVLVAGHLADNAEPFREQLEDGVPWLAVQGADEAPATGVQLLAPLTVTTWAGVEVVALPSPAALTGARRRDLPEKNTPWRVAVAHAPTLTLASPRHDGGDGVLDPGWLEPWEIDYLALGCAHDTRAPSIAGKTTMADPGAARVTSAGETGLRGGFLVELDGGLRVRWLQLSAAGCRREVAVPVAPDGSFDVDTTGWHANDSVCLHLRGLLHPATPNAVEREARRRLNRHARRITIDRRELVQVEAGTAALAESLAWAVQPPQAAHLSRTLLGTAE